MSNRGSVNHWSQQSAVLSRGVKILNGIPSEKLELILKRLVESLIVDFTKKAFTAEEEIKLSNSLSANPEEVSLLLRTSSLILTQASYESIQPNKLKEVLTQTLGLEEDKAKAFKNIWEENSRRLVEKLRHKSIYSNQLDEVSWLVTIESSRSEAKETFLGKGVVQLRLAGEKSDPINLELYKPQLSTLYDTLETIQSHLDTLHHS